MAAATKLVIILGAGATVADVMAREVRKRPPLDKNFFSTMPRLQQYRLALKAISTYLSDTYRQRIAEGTNDSFEAVMATAYTDTFNPSLRDAALETFRHLIRLFNRRLADTTNTMAAHHKRFLYRIIAHYLGGVVAPDDLAIITFNQDLQAEKVLSKLASRRGSGAIFKFPACYKLDIQPDDITAPPGSSGLSLFDVSQATSGVKVLKLHGSLNWYSVHTSLNPGVTALFNTDRKMRITRRQTISPDMTLTGKRQLYTYPIVIPPVTHKSGVMHAKIRSLWGYAEDALRAAGEVIIFGYSCPQIDFESSSMIQRALMASSRDARLVIIDPNPDVLKRYAELAKPKRLRYYPYADSFLKDF